MLHELVKILLRSGYAMSPGSSLISAWCRKFLALQALENEILCTIAGEPEAVKILSEGGRGRDLLWELDRLWVKRGSSPTDPLIEKIRATRKFLLEFGYKSEDLYTQLALAAREQYEHKEGLTKS